MTDRIDTAAERERLRAYGPRYQIRIDGDKYALALDEIDRLREALTYIDALDPEHQVHGFSEAAKVGTILKMGAMARAALSGEDET